MKNTNNGDILLSVVVPMYNEADGIDLFLKRIIPILEGLTPEWEIICINDGSKDATVQLIKENAARDTRIKLVSLSRNFGKEAALTAGLHNASGMVVVPIDADLQDPPELIPSMIAKWQEGYKVVIATRKSRDEDGLLKRLTAKCFYWVIARLTSFPIPANTGDFRLMDRQVVEVIKLLPERTRFMKGLFAWVGFSTAQVFYAREQRAAGKTKFNFRALWRLAKDGIFSFTTLPLRLTTYLGVVISTTAFGYAIWLVYHTIKYGTDLPGYPSLMVAILTIGGIQLICLGILGEYIGRIYRETKHRPLFIVEEKIGL